MSKLEKSSSSRIPAPGLCAVTGRVAVTICDVAGRTSLVAIAVVRHCTVDTVQSALCTTEYTCFSVGPREVWRGEIECTLLVYLRRDKCTHEALYVLTSESCSWSSVMLEYMIVIGVSLTEGWKTQQIQRRFFCQRSVAKV